MKFILTIEAATREEILAQLSGSSAASAIVAAQPQQISMPVGGTNTGAPITQQPNDDDASGDTAAAPGTLDKTGLPWDDRIHSTPATLTTKQVWRARRGVDDATVKAVEYELRNGAQSAPVQQMQPVAQVQQQPMQMPVQAQPTMQQPVMAMPSNPDNFVPPQQQPQMQPVAQVQQQPMQMPTQAAPVQGGVDFPTLMRNIGVGFQTPAQAGGMVIDPVYLAALCASVSVGNISEIQNDPIKIGSVVGKMITEGRWLNA